MTIAINSTSITSGVMTVDATVTAPTGHKLRSFFITCGGEYAYYLIPRTYYVSSSSSYTQTPQVILTGRSISRFPLAQWPNGALDFIVSAKYQNITTGAIVTESTPVTVSVTNTFYEAPQTPDPIIQPGGQLQQPVITVFDVPASVEGGTVPVTLSAKDNNAVAAYFVSEMANTPAANDPLWQSSATTYTLQGSGNVTLYAWAKDADGNISDRVSATVYTPPVVSSLGGAVVGGAAVVAATTVTASVSVVASQGAVAGGSALASRGTLVVSAGGALLSGSAPISQATAVASTGGALISGAAAVSRGIAVISSKGVVISGDAVIESASAAGVAVASTGGVILSGLAITETNRAPPPSGLVLRGPGGVIYSFNFKL